MNKYAKFFIGIILLALLFFIVHIFSQPFDQIFLDTGPAAQFIYVLLIITEVIIAPIPGGVITLLGAAHFGFLRAWALTYIGNIIGLNAAFYLTRKIGRPFVERMVPEQQRKPYEALIQKYPKTVWLAYALPILPVDIITILLGLTNVSHKRFFIITSTGMITYVGLWAFLGSQLAQYVPYLEYISTIVLLGIIGIIAWWFYKEFNVHKKIGAYVKKQLSKQKRKRTRNVK